MRAPVLLAALVACVHRPPGPPEPARVQYQLELVGEFSFEDGEIAEALGGGQVAWSLAVSMAPAERHEDGSVDTVVRFDRVTEVVTWGGEAAAPATAGLEGRSLLVRRFDDGEILAVDWADHVVGDGRDGEVLDLLLPVLSPFPPPLRDGEQARRRARWPVRAADGSGLTSVLESVWTHAGMEEVGGASAWHLRYEGDWTTTGADRGQTPPLRLRGAGEGAGDLRIRETDHAVLTHDFAWERTMTLDNPAMGLSSPVVTQVQRFSGGLRRVTP